MRSRRRPRSYPVCSRPDADTTSVRPFRTGRASMTTLQQPATPASARAWPFQEAPLRIAIADDHAVVRTGYRRLLELDGRMRVVAEFADGESAYQWLCA